jgi:hypothetical protein
VFYSFKLLTMFTFKDLQQANDIINLPHLITGTEADILAYRTWANDVRSFFRSLFKAIRLTHRYWLNDWQLSVKSVWQALRSFANIGSLLTDLRKKVFSLLHVEPDYYYAPVHRRCNQSVKGCGKVTRILRKCDIVESRFGRGLLV